MSNAIGTFAHRYLYDLRRYLEIVNNVRCIYVANLQSFVYENGAFEIF